MEFKRSIDLHCHLKKIFQVAPNNDFNPWLYVNIDWDPDPCPNPEASAFELFEETITNLQKTSPHTIVLICNQFTEGLWQNYIKIESSSYTQATKT